MYDFESDGFTAEFEKGKTVALIVNHAREMSDMPANFLTPDHWWMRQRWLVKSMVWKWKS